MRSIAFLCEQFARAAVAVVKSFADLPSDKRLGKAAYSSEGKLVLNLVFE